jgi:TonB-linked SusC/RagA family outer membrane protein
VLITTKSGKAGKTVFSFDYYYGLQKMQRKWDLVNAVEGMVLRKEALLNTRSDITRNIPAEMFNPFAFATSPEYKNNDWQDVLFRTAPMQDANLSASGGTEAFRYLTSLNYFNQEGIFINTNRKRYSARLNLDVKASSRLNFGLRSTVSTQSGNNTTDGNPFQGTVIGSLFYPQYQQTYNPDGTFWGPPHNVGGTFDTRNFLHEAIDFTRKQERFRYNGNVWGELEITKGLKFRSQFGVDINTLDNRRFNPAIPRGPAFIISGPDLGGGNTSRSYIQLVRSYNWVADQLLTYNTTLNTVHQVNAIAGFSAQQYTSRGLTGQGDGSLNPLLSLVGTNNGQNINLGEGYSENGLVSQFVRVFYGYDDRYLFTGTVRRDGSSNFGPQKRYGIFPAASVAWRVSQEKFMQNVDFIRDLKFRVSYGVVGNQNIGSFQFIPRMGAANNVFGGSVVNGFTLNGIANEGLRWEENEKKDIGLDLTILKGRVDITADYFINTSRGLLLGVPIPQFSGFGSQTINAGSVENKGWELAMNSRNMVGRFRWTTNFNITSVKNKVLDLGVSPSGSGNEYFGIPLFTQGSPFGTINLTRAGWPIGAFYGLQTAGISRTNEEAIAWPTQTGVRTMAGDIRYVDQDKNGVIDERDRVYLGSPFPNLFGGLSNEFNYQNFSLNVLANFVLGQKMFNYARLRLESFGDPWGGAAHLQRWTESNPGTDYPRMTLGNVSGYNRINSDRWIEDASFLRIRNITLGYNFQSQLLQRAHLQSLRLYVSASNLFTITRYKGWDPEAMSSGSNVLSGGIDQGTYPVARTISFGVNCRF